MKDNGEGKDKESGGVKVSGLCEGLANRALLIAEKDKVKITGENAEAYFIAAIAQNDNMITNLMETSKGQQALASVIENTGRRVYEKINQCDGCRRGLPLKNGLHIGEGFNDSICCTKHLYS